MDKKGFVIKTMPDGTALVRISSPGCAGCAGCASSAACGNGTRVLKNTAGAAAGDTVMVGRPGSPGASSAGLCVVPMITFIAALLLTKDAAEAVSALASVGAFLAGAAAAAAARALIIKRLDKKAEITEVV